MNLLDENIREDQRDYCRGGEFQFTNWVLTLGERG